MEVAFTCSPNLMSLKSSLLFFHFFFFKVDKLAQEGNCLEHLCLKTISHFFYQEDSESSVHDVQTGQEQIHVTLDLSDLLG